MLVIALSTVLFILIGYIYVRWLQLKQFWIKRGVPNVPPRPFIGSMTFLQRENPAIWFRRIYDSYKVPYVGIWVFMRPGLIVNSPDIAKNILIRDHANFKNRLVTAGPSDPIGSLNLFTVDDPLWSALRKHLTALFTSSKLRAMQTLVTEKSKELVARIDKDRQKLHPTDLRTLVNDFTTDLIGTASFGVVSDATLTGRSHVRVITEHFMEFNFIRGWAWSLMFFFPELSDFFRFKSFPTDSIEYMRKVLRHAIAQRGGLESKVTDPKDLLDILIKIKQQNELDMTEDMMLAQAAVFVQAGFDSTGTVLALAIYELAFCLEAQEKLVKELKQAQEDHGDNILDNNILIHLTYLNCIIDEALRKYPVMSWIDRVALSDYEVDDNLTIKAGTPVFVNAVGMHYDPDYYPEPDKFMPERFLPENANNVKSVAFLPFGAGPRKCIGQRIGETNIRHALAAVVLNYEIKPLPNTPRPSDLKLESKALFIAPRELLSVDFVPRKKI